MEEVARWWKTEWMLERAKAQARIENINQIVQDQKTAYYEDDTVHKGGHR